MDVSRNGLQEACKRRILDMIRQVSTGLDDSGLDRSGTPQQFNSSRSDVSGTGVALGADRRSLVMIVDHSTLKVLSGACRTHDLVQEGVYLTELIDRDRKGGLPMDALYFLSPTQENIEAMVEDSKGIASDEPVVAKKKPGRGSNGDSSTPKRRPKYKSFHVFFSYKLPEELLRMMAAETDLVMQIKTFKELNLAFFAHDSRTFHFADNNALGKVLHGDVLPTKQLSQCACQLATACATMGARPRIRFCRNGTSGAAPGGCERLAHELQSRLDEIESKGGFEDQGPALCGTQGPFTLVIIDRAFDFAGGLIHDMGYESLVFDVLGGAGGPANVEDRMFKVDEPGEAPRPVLLGSEADALWLEQRHRPIWEVKDAVIAEFRQFKAKDDAMRAKPAGDASMAASQALNTLQRLPEHKELRARLELHLDVIQKCIDTIDKNKIQDIASFEQDLATGVDLKGEDLNIRRIEAQLLALLQDPAVPSKAKLRLLLLHFLMSNVNIERRKELAEGCRPVLNGHERAAALSPTWADLDEGSAEHRQRQAKLADRRRRFRDMMRGDGSPRTKKLWRLGSEVRDIAEAACDGTLDQREFPELAAAQETPLPRKSMASPKLGFPQAGGRHRDSASGTGSRTPTGTGSRTPTGTGSRGFPSGREPPRISMAAQRYAQSQGDVLVFVLGGVTMSEARAAHEITEQRGGKVFVGGSRLLTPGGLLQELTGESSRR